MTSAKARIVLHVRGDRQLAAFLQARDQHGLEVGAGGVDGGGIASRSRAEDQDLAVN